ncbi:hypothetical protein N8837_03640 [Pseudomonadales bacterium]|nr:hypothetical protein [Gammaproteobacteria bacterium]MDA7718330.1 hypothetical protein [Pseudomonadales bacterium]MDA8627293.1 hypothetical protein [Pseudomonadales bacterium]
MEITEASAAAFANDFVETHWLALTDLGDERRAASWELALTEHHLRVPGYPFEHGGRNWSDKALVHFWSLCAEHGCPMPDPVTTELVGPLLLMTAAPSQHSAHLQAIAAGQASWDLVCLDLPSSPMRRLKALEQADWVLLIQNQAEGTSQIEILRPWPGLQANLPPTTTDLKTSLVLSLDAGEMLLKLHRDHQPIAAVWRNRALLKTLRTLSCEDPMGRENQRLCELEILQTAQETLCHRLIQSGARAKQLIVTQIAREIQIKSLQLRHEQLGYYALTEATPPGQNEPIGSINAPIDAHFMIEPITLISDFFMDQLETNTQQGS